MKPYTFTYIGKIKPNYGAMGIIDSANFVTMNYTMSLLIKELPVFKPNEYFWKNHWDPKSGEERWEAYARVIRELIAEHSGCKLGNLEAQDKVKYKKEFKELTYKEALKGKRD